jgi:hypothetical protein
MSGRGSLVVVLLVAGACGDDDGAGGSPDSAGADSRMNPDTSSPDANVASLPYGGEMWVAVQTAPGSPDHFMYGGATFYAAYPLEAPPISATLTEDEVCPPVIGKKPPVDPDAGAAPDAAPEPMPTLLDVGAQVFFTASEMRLTMQKSDGGAYDSDITTAPVIEGGFLGGDGRFEIPGAGEIQSAVWTMALPGPGVATVSPEALTGDEDLQFAWTPTGAMAVYVDVLFLNTTTMDFYFGCVCAFADDGSATMPVQACVDQIPGADTADLAITLVRRRFERHVDLQGRRLLVQAELSDQLDTPILTGMMKPVRDAVPSSRVLRRRDRAPLVVPGR